MNISIKSIRILQIITATLIPISIVLFRSNWPLIIVCVTLLGAANFLLERQAVQKKKSAQHGIPIIFTIVFIAFAVIALALAAWKIKLFE